MTGASQTAGLSSGAIIDGRYEITREIARGTYTAVFEARHRFTGRLVAIKCVPSDVSSPERGASQVRRARQALGAVVHPNVVEVHDAGETMESGAYLAMEKLEGRSLEGILAARRRLPLDEVLYVARCIGGALGYSHRRGVVHRDVRPANIFLCRRPYGTEAVKLIDFGASHLEGEAPKSDRTLRALNLGALDYLCPEQVRNPESNDPRGDQYALAAVLVEALLGTLPSLPDRARAAPALAELRDPTLGISESVISGLSRALSPDPSARFATIEALVDHIGARGAKAISVLSPTRAAAQERNTTPAPLQTAQRAPEAAVTRRRFVRAPYIAPCRVLREDGTHIDGRSEDISEGGMLIVLSQKEETRVEHGAALSSAGALETVQVRFALPTTGVVATAVAIVRWVKDGRGRAALGIEFASPPAEVGESIRTYVRLVGNEAPSA